MSFCDRRSVIESLVSMQIETHHARLDLLQVHGVERPFPLNEPVAGNRGPIRSNPHTRRGGVRWHTYDLPQRLPLDDSLFDLQGRLHQVADMLIRREEVEWPAKRGACDASLFRTVAPVRDVVA